MAGLFPDAVDLTTPARRPSCPADIVALIATYRLPIGNEYEFQMAFDAVCRRADLDVRPEYHLGGDLGRIDFYAPTLRTGIELKIGGSPADVTRQLLRYASSEEIDALVLVTGKARLGLLPPTLSGKPLLVASVWRGGL